MRPAVALWLLLALVACGEGNPLDTRDDLWEGFRHADAGALPTAEDLEAACSEAFSHFKEEAEKTPGTYVDPSYHAYPVRNPVCRAETGTRSTVQGGFEQAEIMIPMPTVEERKSSLERMKESDWRRYRARLVFAANGPGTQRWIAPKGCEPVSAPLPG
jgi:hypothetical protein